MSKTQTQRLLREGYIFFTHPEKRQPNPTRTPSGPHAAKLPQPRRNTVGLPASAQLARPQPRNLRVGPASSTNAQREMLGCGNDIPGEVCEVPGQAAPSPCGPLSLKRL